MIFECCCCHNVAVLKMMYYWCYLGGGGLRTWYDGSMACSESSHDRHWCRHGDGRWYCLFGWSQPAGAKKIDRSGEILRSREVLWPNVVVVSLAPSESLPMVHSWYGWSTVGIGIGIDDESMNRSMMSLGQQWLQQVTARRAKHWGIAKDRQIREICVPAKIQEPSFNFSKRRSYYGASM